MNVKVLYLGEKGYCIMETRVRLQEETVFVFHNVIFLKKFKKHSCNQRHGVFNIHRDANRGLPLFSPESPPLGCTDFTT